MNIKKVQLYHVRMPLKHSVETSFSTIGDKDSIIVEVQDDDGITGWGEAPAFAVPWYTEETIGTVWHMLEDFLIPLCFRRNWAHPKIAATAFSAIQRNNMAKSGLESALWDLYAKREEKSLAAVLGGCNKMIEVGVVIGLQAKVKDVLDLLEQYLTQGYKRIKLKIKPGHDVEPISAMRRQFPEVSLSVDANGAYTLNEKDMFQKMDWFGLSMIEQPLAAGDLLEHAKLQENLRTPLCLDESIAVAQDVQHALELKSCRIINIKMSRVGGLTSALALHDYCQERRIPVWCGGMFETGIGRAHNIALSSLANFSLPGDISASSRYWETDIIEPEVTVQKGEIQVPEGWGIGYAVNRRHLEKVVVAKKTFYKQG
ncbi:MAG: menC [Firmicutes bacterium]|nr:menC [Bacillota bacterium]